MRIAGSGSSNSNFRKGVLVFFGEARKGEKISCSPYRHEATIFMRQSAFRDFVRLTCPKKKSEKNFKKSEKTVKKYFLVRKKYVYMGP
jgi:hypothetical protein